LVQTATGNERKDSDLDLLEINDNPIKNSKLLKE
jgi:predicted nucleotidyltransferase